MIPWASFERRWLRELLGAMIPASPPRPGLAELDLHTFHEDLLRAAPPLLHLGVRTATWALSFAPLFLLGRWSLFAGLSPDDRDRLLVTASESRSFLLRQLVVTVKLAASFAYLRDPGVRRFFPGREAPP